MDKDKLKRFCGMTEKELYRRLANWADADADYIFIPHCDKMKMLGALGYDRQTLKRIARLGEYDAATPARVLAIAHIDTVLGEDWSLMHKGVFYSPALDDRVGVYTICDVLVTLPYDILLTDHEEIGASSGALFETGKEYNWMFQFDRRGSDVVMYEYETADLAKRIRTAGCRVGVGSFSDISAMTHLGISGFNWGCGYEKEHSRACHVIEKNHDNMVRGFTKFWQANASVRMSYIAPVWDYSLPVGIKTTNARSGNTFAFWDEADSVLDECENCGELGEVKYDRFSGMILCAKCDESGGEEWGECPGCNNDFSLLYQVGDMRLCAKCAQWFRHYGADEGTPTPKQRKARRSKREGKKTILSPTV